MVKHKFAHRELSDPKGLISTPKHLLSGKIASILIPLTTSLVLSCSSKNSHRLNSLDQTPVLSSIVANETRSRIEFSRHVAPILTKRCLACHNSERALGQISLSNAKTITSTLLVPQQPSQSPLYLAALGFHPSIKNTKKEVKLAKSDSEILKRWILSGAVWPNGEAGLLTLP